MRPGHTKKDHEPQKRGPGNHSGLHGMRCICLGQLHKNGEEFREKTLMHMLLENPEQLPIHTPINTIQKKNGPQNKPSASRGLHLDLGQVYQLPELLNLRPQPVVGLPQLLSSI